MGLILQNQLERALVKTKDYIDKKIEETPGSGHSDANVKAVDIGEEIEDVETEYVTKIYVDNAIEDAINQIGAGGGGITEETDPIFSASPAASITEEKKEEWDNKMDKVTLATVATSGNYNDLSNKPTIPAEQVNADWNATSGKAQILNKPTIPSAVTESTVSGWGFTKNTGTYSKPSTGIPKSDLASAVQTSLGKADTALQSYTEQYKGTITGVSANGTSVATSGVANIPAASTSAYGVTKLSSATNSTSTSLAATASAVKAAYDLANSYKGTVTGVKINGTTKNPSSGVVDLGTVITSHQDISSKQDKLVSGTNIKTINGTSILGSGDITISGGSSSGSGAYAEVNHGTSDTTFALTPNTFHVWDEVANLTLNLGSETAGVANEFLFQFNSGATATTLSLPSDLKWANDAAPTIEPNMIYQVSILKGLASVLEFSNVSLITFYVDNVEYKAEAGMTWNDWMESKYNTVGFYTDGMGSIILGDKYVTEQKMGEVYPEEEILEGHKYKLLEF